MKLYPKKLNSLNALEREKARLLRKKKAMDKEDFLSLGALAGGRKGKEEAGGIWESLGDVVQPSNPVLGIVKDIVMSLIAKATAAKEPAAEPHESAPKKKKKSILHRLAWEFVGGYLKWKAIELSYKGIRYYMRKRKEEAE